MQLAFQALSDVLCSHPRGGLILCRGIKGRLMPRTSSANMNARLEKTAAVLTYCRMWNIVQLSPPCTTSNEKQGRVIFIYSAGQKYSIRHIREYLPYAAPFPSTYHKVDKGLSALISHVSYRCWHVPLLVQDHACETTQTSHRSANLPAAISSAEQNSLFSSHQSPLNFLVFSKNTEIQT